MNTETTYHLILRRRYADRYSVFNLRVSLDAMDDYWRDELTLTKTNYAYILSSNMIKPPFLPLRTNKQKVSQNE